MKIRFMFILLAIPMIGITPTDATEKNDLVVEKEHYNAGHPSFPSYKATVRDGDGDIVLERNNVLHMEVNPVGDRAAVCYYLNNIREKTGEIVDIGEKSVLLPRKRNIRYIGIGKNGKVLLLEKKVHYIGKGTTKKGKVLFREKGIQYIHFDDKDGKRARVLTSLYSGKIVDIANKKILSGYTLPGSSRLNLMWEPYFRGRSRGTRYMITHDSKPRYKITR